MRRTLRPGLLLTATAATAACAGGAPLPGNPPGPLKIESAQPPFSVGSNLNPRIAGAGMVYGTGDRCWIELPSDEPMTSWRPPKTQDVPCPDAMKTDPAWAACKGGTMSIVSMSPLACQCYFDGNPPPPPERVACPTLPGLDGGAIPEVK